ncbi:hypothetical protein HanRHA438_Chr15g0730551 [Helianthus annuus]|uniref:Uncharacterized protein n=1 Tax=Helianthus annuus TaxID=4232 RepID=A0A9K3H5C3_HELAN|nr:hypothetical protein HanXRQr2_Chr15g0718221 [Helianthus annuus]KAJ0833327.1 hypothetical protein HanPSC8_Chr15g0689071 [Helianthus annuus]KAJ0846940.1 hypothetical protein HanRHA438_Chr15g0730551 [Helianthus annuus]
MFLSTYIIGQKLSFFFVFCFDFGQVVRIPKTRIMSYKIDSYKPLSTHSKNPDTLSVR